jgi:hypothetical protein
MCDKVKSEGSNPSIPTNSGYCPVCDHDQQFSVDVHGDRKCRALLENGERCTHECDDETRRGYSEYWRVSI